MAISTTARSFKHRKCTVVNPGVLNPEKFHEPSGGEDDIAENKGSGIMTQMSTKEQVLWGSWRRRITLE